MGVLSHIGYGIEKELITVVMEAGLAGQLITKYCEQPGVLSISRHHARGVGSTRVRTGQLYFDERDVLLVLVEAEHAPHLFEALFQDAKIGRAGGGLMFAEKVLRGHPMMPFDDNDW